MQPSPGSRARLLPLSPLRTARESFPSSRASLANAPCGTRSCHGLTRPSPYALGASTPLSGRSVHQAVLPLPSSAFSPQGGGPRALVMQDQTDVSALSRGVILRGCSTPLHPMTGWPALLPSSPSRTPLGLPYGSLSLQGKRTGLPCSVAVTTHGVGALCPPGACEAHDKEGGSPCPRSRAFLAQAFQPLWLVVCDDVSRAFPWVHPPIHPRPVSVFVRTETSAPHGCDASRGAVGPWSGGSGRVVTFPHISVGYR